MPCINDFMDVLFVVMKKKEKTGEQEVNYVLCHFCFLFMYSVHLFVKV